MIYCNSWSLEMNLNNIGGLIAKKSSMCRCSRDPHSIGTCNIIGLNSKNRDINGILLEPRG